MVPEGFYRQTTFFPPQPPSVRTGWFQHGQIHLCLYLS
jgi:hypothetical protein